MNFSAPLLRGTLLRRYKRFFADIQLDDGREIIAHCPNTGAMTGCAEPGFIAYVSENNDPKRKLKFTWELAQTAQGHWIGINTHRANKLVEEALLSSKTKVIDGIEQVRREVKLLGSESRFDFTVATASNPLEVIEVKSVTLARGSEGVFPDAVTSRGLKHVTELHSLVLQGTPAHLVFCVQHTAITSVGLAQDVDPKYAQAVRAAVADGLKVHALGCLINQEKTEVNQVLPVIV